MAIIGYIRLSSKKQTLEHQEFEIKKFAQTKKLKLSKNTKRIKDLLDKGVSQYKISKIMQVQPMTVNRFIHRMGWE